MPPNDWAALAQREAALRERAAGLDDEAFRALIGELIAGCPPQVRKRHLGSPDQRREVRELVLAGELILARPGFDQADPLACRIFAEATRYIDCYSDDFAPHDVASRCRQLLDKTANLDAFRPALDFISRCPGVPDLGYRIDDARYSALGECMEIVRHAARLHADEIESRLIDWVSGAEPNAAGARAEALLLMADLGTRRSFDCMRAFIASGAAEEFVCNYRGGLLWDAPFRWIERDGFAPGAIRALNETTSAQRGRPRIMAAYHHELREYASTFAELTGGSLYERLESGGVQFWNYWMTYAPAVLGGGAWGSAIPSKS